MRLRASLLGAVIAALAAAAPAHASTYTVTGTADTAGVTCSGTVCPTLRSAVTEAARVSGADTIKLTAGTYAVDLGVLTLADTVSIVGDTAQNTTIQSGGKTRVFIVTGAANSVTLSHLTLTGGAAASSNDGVGGDVHVTGGATLNMDHVRVTGGTAITGGGGIGIDTNSTAVIAESTIDTNTTQIPGVSSSGEGGGIASIGIKGGAGNHLTLTDSSVYNNTSSTSAGLAVSDNANNVTTITRSTIALNRGNMGGGAGVWTNDTEKINVIGSIVAGNTGDGGASNCSRALTSQGGNIDTGNLCGFDKPNTDPQLGSTPVQFADTPMLTFPATSPAIDLLAVGSAACKGAITDQRDLARPQGAGCDAGAFEIDTVPPDVTITAGPNGPTNNASPSFSFSSTDATATFGCKLDVARAPTPCTSPLSYSGLADGAHTFAVTATDPALNKTTVSRSFTVDTAAPLAPTITTPASNISQASTSIALGGSAEPNSTVIVSEGATVLATVIASGQGIWSATFTAADGVHTYTANARDAAGNTSPASNVRTITVDTTPPETTITSGPAGATNLLSPSFGFSSETGATFQCKLDGPGTTTGSYATCTSPKAYGPLADGAYTFSVRATDTLGNTDPTPATRAFTLDTVVPTVSITSGPSGLINVTSASFGFTAETGATTTCQMDTGGFTPCTSPAAYSSLAQGSHTFTVRATDAAGNVGSASRTITVDTIAPAAPAITTPPSDTSQASTTVTIGGTAEPSASVQLFDNGVAKSTTAASGQGTWSVTLNGVGDGAHPFTAKATDTAGNVSGVSNTRTITVDTTAPETTITSGPAGATNGTSPSFGFSSEAGATFQCKLDGPGATTGSYATCTSPKAYGPLADGVYTFSVRATDTLGNTDPTPATRGFTVDTAPPSVSVTSGPNGPSASTSASFGFTAETGATTTCQMDSGSFASCTSPAAYSGLGQGLHTFTVRAADAAGNAATASRSFTVDTIAPSVTVTSGPNGPSASTSASFGFTAETGATTTCQMDAGGFTSCTSPAAYSSLAQGGHTFTVRATDAAGNSATDTRSFTVDTIAPSVTVTSGPSGPSASTSASFGFTAETGATTTCQMDAGGFTSCTSPAAYSSLAQGSHTFSVRATDAAGNVNTVSRAFTVDTIPPTVTITSGPSGATPSTSASFGFTAETGATTTCQMDAGAFTSCTSPAAYSGLAQGGHTFTVRATDAAGNSATDTRSFSVDTSAPTVTITSGPSGPTNSASPSFGFTADAGTTTTCQIDSGAFASCTSPASFGGLTQGPHTFTVRAADAAGNSGTDSRSFTVDTIAPSAPAITAPADNVLQNSAAVTLSGTSEGNATITISEGATQRGTTTATAGGTWSLTFNATDGSHTYTAKATDAAGNTSGASNTRTVRVDTTAPAAPAITSPADNTLQNSAAVTLSGTSEGNATITVSEGATQRGTTTATAGGTWSLTFNATDGSHTYTAKATDAAGNTSGASNTRTVRVDTAVPAAPAITSPAADLLQASASVTISGTAEDNATVELFDNGVSTGTTTAADGTWSFTLNVADGSHPYTAKATDAAGNTSAASATRRITVDTTAPAAPAITAPIDNSLQSSNNVTVSGTSEGSAKIAVFEGATQRATTTATAGGTWTLTLNNVDDGSHTYTAKATDAAGNTSAVSNARTVRIDTTPPAAPLITAPPADTLQKTAAVSLSGTAEPNATVELFDNGSSKGTTTASAGGGWSFTLSTVADGAHPYTAKATDAAGNTSSASSTRTITVDTTAPNTTITGGPSGATMSTAPSFTFSSTEANSTFACTLTGPGQTGTPVACTSPTGYSGLADGAYTFSVRATDAAGNADATAATQAFTVDNAAPGATITGGPSGPTNSASPSFAFTAETGATFECRLDGATFTSCTSPKTYAGLVDGAHTFSVRATDVAGNTGTAATRDFTVDTAAPAAPAITNAQNTGSTVTLSGTAEPNATVTIFDGSTQRGSVSAAGDGSWTATLNAVPDGSHTYTAKATDAAGNTSGASNARMVDIDTGAPAAPVIGTPAATTIQNTNTVTLAGAAEAGATVEVFDGAASAGTTTATPDSTWTLTLANVPDGTHTYTAKATDFAHNVSPASAPRTITVDTTPPPATVTGGPDGPTTNPSPSFTFGSSDSATTFDCKLDGPGSAQGTFGACSSPKSFDALSPGDYTFSVRATDPAGNRTVTSRAFSVALVQQATPTPTPTPGPVGPAQNPVPVYQKTVVIQPAGGKTLVQLPGTKTFVPVDVTRGIPLGSIVDTRHSKIRLYAIPKPGKPAESALFYDGLFKVTQLANGVTQLVLVEQLAKCPSSAKAASIAKKKPKTRKLWGDGSGAFSTKGQYSAATVRGTKWLVQDSCGKTLTRVAKGVVSVQDLVKRKTILVRAPKSYTALAKKKR